MTDQEYGDVGAYLVGLWPEMRLTNEQQEVWRQQLRRYSLHTVRQAIANVYGVHKFKEPKISEVTSEIHRLRTRESHERKAESFGITAEHLEQVRQEEAEESAALEGWSHDDLEMAWAEILRHEPWFGKLEIPAASIGPMRRHLIVERFIHKRAVIFPRGEALEVAVEDYWRVRQ